MNITLKGIKHSAFASEETHCFEATVYVDGKRAFIAKNNGHGGGDDYYPLAGGTHREVMDMVAKIDKELGKEVIKGDGYEIENDLEIVVGELVNQWLADKEIKKVLKTVAYVKGGEVYTLSAKIKPTAQTLKLVKGASWWKPEYRMLNGLPIEEIRQYF